MRILCEGNSHLMVYGTGTSVAAARTNAESKVEDATSNLFKQIFTNPFVGCPVRRVADTEETTFMVNRGNAEVWTARALVAIAAYKILSWIL